MHYFIRSQYKWVKTKTQADRDINIIFNPSQLPVPSFSPNELILKKRMEQHWLFIINKNKMKHKLSISIEMGTVLQMFEKIKDGTFRNKSHLVEFAVQKYLEEQGLKI